MILNDKNETDILGITETWLNENYSGSDMEIDGYLCNERQDRQGSRGGGILLYIKQHSI